MPKEIDRFTSFAERYIIMRAQHFSMGKEKEQAWLALQDAKGIYGMVQEDERRRQETEAATQAGVDQQAQQAGRHPIHIPRVAMPSVMPPLTVAQMDAVHKLAAQPHVKKKMRDDPTILRNIIQSVRKMLP